MTAIIDRYNSLAAVVDFCKQPPANEHNLAAWLSLKKHDDPDYENDGHAVGGEHWYGPGVKTAAEVSRYITEGWAEGVRLMDEALGKIRADIQPQEIRRRKVRGPEGDELDMQRVYAGDLDHAWTSTRRTRTQGGSPIVTIAAQIGASYKTPADCLFWRGAAVLKLSDMLTEAGYQVEIMAQNRVQGAWPRATDKDHDTVITVKRSDEPLNKNSLAACLAMAGFARTLIFKSRFIRPWNVSSGLGHPDHRFLDEFSGPDVIRAPYDLYSQQQAEAWINSVLKKFEAISV